MCLASAGKSSSWTTVTKSISKSSALLAMGTSTTNRRSQNSSQTSPIRKKNRYHTMNLPETERILVFDFGSQYGQLIARRVREQNVFCQIVRHGLSADRVRELKPSGMIFSGGPASVYGQNAPSCDPRLFELGIPVLGICYGMQLACHLMGARV